MSSFTPQQIEDFLQEFFDVVGARQYVGARYVPIFGRAGEDTVEWDDGAPYEPLTVVMHQGVSYVSRRYVPTGIQVTDTDYWVETYRFNAQVEQYRQEVLGFQGQIDQVREDMESDYVPFPDPDTYPKYGTMGQVLTTLTDGETKWEDPVTVDAEIAEPLIEAWLDDHPEATTTVQDGSITYGKLNESLLGANLVMYRGDIRNLQITDLNDLTGNGVYQFADYTGVSNAPIDSTNVPIVGTIIVFAANNNRIGQLLAGRDGLIWYRVKINDSVGWTDWHHIADPRTLSEQVLSYKGGLDGTGTDLNTLRFYNAIYRVSDWTGLENLPVANDEPLTGILVVIVNTTQSEYTKAIQLYSAGNLKFYYRICSNETWGAWRIVANDKDISDVYDQVNSSFVQYGRISDVIKNVNVVNYDGYVGISNLRHDYSGNQNGFIVYGTDETGTQTSVEIARENYLTELTGHYIAQIPAYDTEAYVAFDYDLSQVTSGTRITTTGPQMLVDKKRYINLPSYFGDFGFIQNFGVIGDSYASGEIYTEDPSAQSGYSGHDYYDLSWGKILARKFGSNCVNFSKGGLTTRSWLTDAMGLTLLNSSPAQELYFCALGINDIGKLGTGYIGSLSDIHDNDPSLNADTFYGNYGRIIMAIKTKAPTAKIVMMQFPYQGKSAAARAFVTAINAIADHYSIPVTPYETSFFCDDSWYRQSWVQNHPIAATYAGMAKEYERIFSKLVIDYSDYFKDFVGNA